MEFCLFSLRTINAPMPASSAQQPVLSPQHARMVAHKEKKQINNDLFSISLSCKSRFFILHHVAFLEATETSSWCTKEYPAPTNRLTIRTAEKRPLNFIQEIAPLNLSLSAHHLIVKIYRIFHALIHSIKFCSD